MTGLPRHLVVALLAALASVAIASRWMIISGHASPVPFHDQWSAEGTAIFEPWFKGELHLADFWAPSNEHRPALTRALAFAEFRLTGEWNTRLQMLVNSLFYALTAVVLALVARVVLGTRRWVVATVLLALLFAMPCTYENAMWGFQSQYYLMMLLGAAYLGGTFCSTRIGPLWISAQVLGAIGLFSMGGGMLAPAAAAGCSVVRLAKRRNAHGIATLLVAVALAVAGWAMVVPPNDPSGVLVTHSPTILVESLVKLLAWPSTLWFLVPLMLAPWLLVTVRALIVRETRSGEIALAAFGGWIALQAAAIAYSRGAGMTEIPPRYFDSMIVAFLVNGACLALLFRARNSRIPVSVLGTAWVVASVFGLWHFNRPERTNAILTVNGGLQQGTLEAVRNYIKTGDPAALTHDAFVAHHFPSIPIMRRLLDNPGVRASLPATVRGESAPSGIERFTDAILASGPWVLGMGFIVLASAGSVILIRAKREQRSETPPESVPWLAAAPFPVLAAIVLIACGMHPWETNPRRRLARIFEGIGEPAKGFEIPGAIGAVYAGGGIPPGLFFGTFIGADSFEGDKVSTTFSIPAKFLLVPIAGYPSGPGNSLRLEILAPDGSIVRKVDFTGPSPGEQVSSWSIRVDGRPGLEARLVLADGSNKPHGWLGIATPLLADDPHAARRLATALQAYRAAAAHRFPAVLLAASVLLAGCGLIVRRRSAAVS